MTECQGDLRELQIHRQLLKTNANERNGMATRGGTNMLLRSRFLLPLLAALSAHALSRSAAQMYTQEVRPIKFQGFEHVPQAPPPPPATQQDDQPSTTRAASSLEADTSDFFGRLVSFLYNGGPYGEDVPKEALYGPKRFFLFACLCALLFLMLKKTVQGIEEHDGRPVRVVLQRSGGRCVGKSFPRESCQTLGQLKRLISSTVENASKEDQTVVFNGRELTDDAMDLAQCLPGVTGDELWLDQRVYPNHWSLLNLKQPKRKVKLVSWGFCKSYDMENVTFAFLLCLSLSILGSF